MRVRTLIHLEHENLGNLRGVLEERGAEIEETDLWNGDALPDLSAFDFLVVMGGAMNADEETRYPWLAEEKRLIREAIESGKRVLGICLGAQLIARALGAEVRTMGYKEIGWFPVRAEEDRHPYFPTLPRGAELTVAHWHGDRFSLPPGCRRLFSSAACGEQGFILEGRPVVGLQFHAELDAETLRAFVEHDAGESGDGELAAGGDWVQTPEEIIANAASYAGGTRMVLENLAGALLG